MSTKTIETRINELAANNYGATVIRGILKAEGYDKEAIKAANIASQRSNEIDANAIMAIVIENESKANKDIIKAVHEAGLCELSTARHIVSLLKFCKAYHELKIS